MIDSTDVGKRTESVSIPKELALLPNGDIIFPGMLAPLAAKESTIITLIDNVVAGNKMLACFTPRDMQKEITIDNFYPFGVAAIVARMIKMPEGAVRAVLQGVARIKLVRIIQTDPFIQAEVEPVEEKTEKNTETEALMRNLVNLFQRMVKLAPNLPEEAGIAIVNITEPGVIADFIAAYSNLSFNEKQEILEELDIQKRLKKVTGYITREIEILELGSKIQTQIKDEMGKLQREMYLREQLKAIKKELGETDEQTMEINELKQKVTESQLPPEAQKEAERELDRLSKMPPQAAEYTVAKTYLDWIVSLPWNKSSPDNMDVKRAAEILDQDHYDLEKVKARILEYLAVRALNKNMKGPILCFVGPPGTGKTSMGQSIARALGREFIRMSLGGIRDEAEIRGHRRTYVGALPGRIIQGIRRAGTNNPVFMLDEIDKVGADFRGDPSAALLEMLDPEQNHAFFDHYLDVPFDLSKVIFITTANLADPILPALKDRMEILELRGYTDMEKLEIAKKFLIPRQLKQNGITTDHINITDESLLDVGEISIRNCRRSR
ncbi:MAG: endopeptidase La [Chloroflexi bacterium]|nr:endopeptidase La [Chloroflexota bacterium]